MGMTILLTGEDALWPHRVDATVYYTGKAYFRPLLIAIVPDAYDEWIYTVSDGTEILIAENNTGALLFAELENAYITVTITTNNNLIATGDDPKPSKQAIEQLAELFDFSIHPQVTDMDAVRTKLDESWEAWKTEEDERNKPVYFKGDFAEYLKKTYTKMSPSVFYTFYDINADGVEDLLLGDKDGTFSSAKAFYDGNMVDLHLSGPFHLCEDGVVEGHSSNGTYSSYGYYKLEGFDAQGRGSHVKLLEFLSYDSQENIYRYSDDGTDMPTVEVSEETAMAILEKHVHINLDMKPLMEFPIDEAGTTLEEYICANEVHITDKEQMAIYAEELQKAINSDTVEYNYYCLWDINGDGMEDLLLAEKDSFFTDAITIHNGEPYILWHWTHFNICENGVIKITSRNNQADRYHFFAYQDGERYLVDYLEYIATEDQWNRSSDGDYEIDQTITAEQANGILGSYIPINPELRPISEAPYM